MFTGLNRPQPKLVPYPKVIVPQPVLAAMVRQVLLHDTIETGWGQWGLINEGRNAFIRGIFEPVPEDVQRQYAHTVVGGSHEAGAMQWLLDNWERMKRLTPNQFRDGVELSHLFKGHSHHRLGVYNYSGVDIASIRRAVIEDGLPVAIGPLANILDVRQGIANREFPFEDRGVRVVEDFARVQIKFYYLARWMVRDGITEPVKINPYIVPDDRNQSPVPPLPWQYINPELFARQTRQLTNYGCEVNVAHRDVPGEPYLLVQMVVTHPGWRGVLSIMTHYDFPHTPPQFEVFAGGKPYPVDNSGGQIWCPGMDFIEAVWNMERKEWL